MSNPLSSYLTDQWNRQPCTKIMQAKKEITKSVVLKLDTGLCLDLRLKMYSLITAISAVITNPKSMLTKNM